MLRRAYADGSGNGGDFDVGTAGDEANAVRSCVQIVSLLMQCCSCV
jgi:hypothetical protein